MMDGIGAVHPGRPAPLSFLFCNGVSLFHRPFKRSSIDTGAALSLHRKADIWKEGRQLYSFIYLPCDDAAPVSI